ncbi:F0F1 ATP synthase subunit B [Pseudoxanthobacter sp.]|uniref:F0F1 ATP synthase subunit B n=1 Tax=Pseudoxanthobacter sp. TaxID=1925742 RepID=UPI002FE3D34B
MASDAASGAETHGAVTDAAGNGATQPAEGHTEVPGSEGAFPPFDPASFPSQIFWLAVTFGALYIMMKRVIAPRIGAILEERRDRIVGDLGEAERLREETDAVIKAYEAELTAARRQATALAEERRAAAAADLAAKRAEVEASLAAKLSDAEQRIAAIKTAALADVNAIASDTAAAVIETLAPVTADPAEIAAAVASVRNQN